MTDIFSEFIVVVDARTKMFERYHASAGDHDKRTANYWLSAIQWANRRIEDLLQELRGS